MAVDWLSLPQQRLLFRSLDSNRDGRIDLEELKALAQRRGQIELLRQDAGTREQPRFPPRKPGETPGKMGKI